jgi:hypothetical protein
LHFGHIVEVHSCLLKVNRVGPVHQRTERIPATDKKKERKEVKQYMPEKVDVCPYCEGTFPHQGPTGCGSWFDGTTCSFRVSALNDDDMDMVEDHILKTYSPGLREAIIEGLYNQDAEYVTRITKVTTTVVIEIRRRK